MLRCLAGEVARRPLVGREVGCGVLRRLSQLTGHSAAVAGGCLVAGKGLLAERGRRSGEAIATPVAQCVGHDYQRIEAAELPSESGVRPPDSRGSRAWRSEVPMPPKTERWRRCVLIACRLLEEC